MKQNGLICQAGYERINLFIGTIAVYETPVSSENCVLRELMWIRRLM